MLSLFPFISISLTVSTSLWNLTAQKLAEESKGPAGSPPKSVWNVVRILKYQHGIGKYPMIEKIPSPLQMFQFRPRDSWRKFQIVSLKESAQFGRENETSIWMLRVFNRPSRNSSAYMKVATTLKFHFFSTYKNY